MKLLKKLLPAVTVAAAFASSGAVHASTVAAADLNIFSIGLVDTLGNPLTTSTGSIAITSESRTGTSDSSYNGVAGTGTGLGSITSTSVGATVDVKNRCAGDCGAGTLALYGSILENNTTTHLASPGTQNFALGDMFISGTALGGSITGLTRADSMSASSNNVGGSNSTIKNAAQIVGTFTALAGFTGSIAIAADWYLKAFVDTILPTKGSADVGMGWNMTITSTDDLTFSKLTFAPTDLNQSSFATNLAESTVNQDNNSIAGIGQLYTSDTRTFLTGNRYNFSINQSSNAAISEIPEPASLALVGLCLVVAGVARRKIVS